MSDIKSEIFAKIRELVANNQMNSNEFKIYDFIRLKMDNHSLESILNEVREEYSNEEDFIRNLEMKFLNKEYVLSANSKSIQEILKNKKYNINDINRLTNKLMKEFPEYSKDEIESFIYEDYKSKMNKI